MPTHCSNKLRVTGSSSAISDFMKKNRTKDTFLDFCVAVPEPAKPDNYGWYDWRSKNWGTTWHLYNIEVVKITSSELVYEFDTACTPPLAWLKAASAKCPKVEVTMTFVDELYEHFGTTTVKKGVVKTLVQYTDKFKYLKSKGILELNPMGTKAEFDKLVKDYNLSEYNFNAQLLMTMARP